MVERRPQCAEVPPLLALEPPLGAVDLLRPRRTLEPPMIEIIFSRSSGPPCVRPDGAPADVVAAHEGELGDLDVQTLGHADVRAAHQGVDAHLDHVGGELRVVEVEVAAAHEVEHGDGAPDAPVALAVAAAHHRDDPAGAALARAHGQVRRAACGCRRGPRRAARARRGSWPRRRPRRARRARRRSAARWRPRCAGRSRSAPGRRRWRGCPADLPPHRKIKGRPFRIGACPTACTSPTPTRPTS